MAGFLAIAFIHSARNLVGDIRDIERDKYEWPARYGMPASMWAFRGLMMAGLVSALGLPCGYLDIGIPVGTQWLLAEYLSLRFGRSQPQIAGYVGHRVFVLTFTVMELLVAVRYGASVLVCIMCFAVAVGLNLTYSLIPGKLYPDWRTVFRPSGSCL